MTATNRFNIWEIDSDCFFSITQIEISWKRGGRHWPERSRRRWRKRSTCKRRYCHRFCFPCSSSKRVHRILFQRYKIAWWLASFHRLHIYEISKMRSRNLQKPNKISIQPVRKASFLLWFYENLTKILLKGTILWSSRFPPSLKTLVTLALVFKGLTLEFIFKKIRNIVVQLART